MPQARAGPFWGIGQKEKTMQWKIEDNNRIYLNDDEGNILECWSCPWYDEVWQLKISEDTGLSQEEVSSRLWEARATELQAAAQKVRGYPTHFVIRGELVDCRSEESLKPADVPEGPRRWGVRAGLPSSIKLEGANEATILWWAQSGKARDIASIAAHLGVDPAEIDREIQAVVDRRWYPDVEPSPPGSLGHTLENWDGSPMRLRFTDAAEPWDRDDPEIEIRISKEGGQAYLEAKRIKSGRHYSYPISDPMAARSLIGWRTEKPDLDLCCLAAWISRQTNPRFAKITRPTCLPPLTHGTAK